MTTLVSRHVSFHSESDLWSSDAIGCVVEHDAQRVAVRR